MTYTEPLSNQVLMFISSIGPGVLIGFIYDAVFSFFHAPGNKKAVIIFSDLSFSLIATLISFFYMVLFNSGTIRVNIVIAQIIGAVAFHYTLGKYISKIAALSGRIIIKISDVVFKPLRLLDKAIMKKLCPVVDKLKNTARFRKNKYNLKEKIMNILKIHLKK